LLKVAAGRLSRVAVLSDIDPELYRRTLATPIGEAARILDVDVPPPIQVADPQGWKRHLRRSSASTPTRC
jgi:hypothetical protein